MNSASEVVLNLQKDRYTPLQNGYKNPMMKAQTTGPMNSGNQRRIWRRVGELLPAAAPCLRFNSITPIEIDY